MKIKRLLAFSLGIVMVVSTVPILVFADENEETTETTIVETTEPKETKEIEDKEPSETKGTTDAADPTETEEKKSGESKDTESEEIVEGEIPSDTASVEAKNANSWGKLKWSLNKSTGVLSVSGKGNMPAITSSKGAPWISDSYDIKKIVIGKGITSISDYAFYWCDHATSVTIPSGVKSIGKFAFYRCDGLLSIKLPSSVRTIGDEAFAFCDGIKTLKLNKGLKTISCFFAKSGGKVEDRKNETPQMPVLSMF